jgi:hypothetical protein
MTDAPKDEERYETYLLDVWRTEATKYDRTILSLAGGALALSITFMRDIAASPPKAPLLIGLGWIALLLSMGLSIS